MGVNGESPLFQVGISPFPLSPPAEPSVAIDGTAGTGWDGLRRPRGLCPRPSGSGLRVRAAEPGLGKPAASWLPQDFVSSPEFWLLFAGRGEGSVSGKFHLKSQSSKAAGRPFNIHCSGLGVLLHCPCLGQTQTPQTSWGSPPSHRSGKGGRGRLPAGLLARKQLNP